MGPVLPYAVTALAALAAAAAFDWWVAEPEIDWRDLVLKVPVYWESVDFVADVSGLPFNFVNSRTAIDIYSKSSFQTLTSTLPYGALICDIKTLTPAKYNHIFQRMGVRPKMSFKQLRKLQNVLAVCLVTTGDVFTLNSLGSQVPTQE